MRYSRIHVKNDSFDTFKKLKHKLEIDSDVDTFSRLMEYCNTNLEDIKEYLKTSDRVAGQ